MYEVDLQEKLQRLMWLNRKYTWKTHMQHGPMADTSRGQGRVLAALKMQPEISTKDLAFLLGIRTQSLNELLSKLEKNEFITRAPAEADKRVVMVKITEKGQNEKQQETELFDIFDCLNEEEQQSFGAYLDRVIAALEAQIGSEPDDAELEWTNAARARFGENFDDLLAMRRGGNPCRRGGFPGHGGFGGHPKRNGQNTDR
ncbi:MAG: MarR family transcriptional regulator [Christensenellaceae bacterium]|jgi:DNA-binding MarR family transcriptional regulator|nr:MarR family transcriptional regulator [Christensenellaceae bacterium]